MGGGSKEGALDATDFPALRVPLPLLKGHLTSLITLGLETIAKTAPEVSFIHDYPGTVITGLYRNMDEPPFDVASSVPIDESGERHLYLATSARFPPREGRNVAIESGDGLGVAVGTTGAAGSGVYSVGEDCESASEVVVQLLAGLREKGMVEEVWRHTVGEFERVAMLDGGL